jgi:hypothetical protein
MSKLESICDFFIFRERYKLTKYLENVLLYNSPNFYKYHLKANKERNFFWINNPKVAGSRINIDLINILLNKNLKNKQRGHYEIDWYKSVSDVSEKETIKLLFNKDIFKFSFVRNPYDRLVSSWTYFCIDLDKEHKNNNQVRTIMKQRGIKEEDNISFETFVNLVYDHWKQTGKFDNEHWFEQNKVIMYDLIGINFIGKLENFDKDYEYVLKKINAPKKFIKNFNKKENASTRNFDYKNLYNKDLQEKVYEMYEKDFTMFNYSKDLQ